MGDQTRLPIEWKAGQRFVIGWLAGQFISSVLVMWKLSGFDGPEYGLFWIVSAAAPLFVWFAAHVDRLFRYRKAEGLSATFLTVGMLSGLPAFLVIYGFRLMFTIHRR